MNNEHPLQAMSHEVFGICLYTDDSSPICTFTQTGPVGRFDIDPNNGQLVYFRGDNDCSPYEVSCIKFCNNLYEKETVTGVVSSTALSFDDNWTYDVTQYPADDDFAYEGNDYETGAKGHFRQKNKYTYVSDYTTGTKNYDKGTYELSIFNLSQQTNQANEARGWKKTSTVLAYSPNGQALEEENILGIKSAAKFGYSKTVPYLIAQNAAQKSVFFESFEDPQDDPNNNSDNQFEDGMEIYGAHAGINTQNAHTGSKCLELFFDGDGNGLGLGEQILDQNGFEAGISIKMWVKSQSLINSSDPTNSLEDNLTLQVQPKLGGSKSVKFKKLAGSGEWNLFEAKLSNTDLIEGFGMVADDGGYFSVSR